MNIQSATTESRRRRVPVFPGECNLASDNKDFVIDEDDYLIICEVLLGMGIPDDKLEKEARKRVKIRENDEE